MFNVKMMFGVFVLFLSVIVGSRGDDNDTIVAPDSPKKLVCYFSSVCYYQGRFTPEHIDTGSCTHINYDFAILNPYTYQIDFGDRKLDQGQQFYQRVIALKQKNSQLKVLLCLGGWQDSTEKYSQLARDPQKRAIFIGSVVPFLQEHGFDGLDIAWEYPNCWQGACGCYPDDVANFVSLLQELRVAFTPQSLLLTASVSALRDEIDVAYDVKSISNLLDYMTVMTYDMHGAWEKMTAHHAQFYPHPSDKTDSLNLDTSVNHWTLRGAVKSKLVIGIPSYGRSFTLSSPYSTGLYAPVLGMGEPGPITQEGGIFGFHELCRERGRWSERSDDLAGTYAVKGNQWVGYDSPIIAASKARYIVKNGYGGAAYKNFHNDDYDGVCFGLKFPILRSILYGLTVFPPKDFETVEKDEAIFVRKMQLAVIVDENAEAVQSAEEAEGVSSDSNIVLHLRINDEGGGSGYRELDVNAGTLTAVGGQMDGQFLELLQKNMQNQES